jgi:hypothetical protein
MTTKTEMVPICTVDPEHEHLIETYFGQAMMNYAIEDGVVKVTDGEVSRAKEVLTRYARFVPG